MFWWLGLKKVGFCGIIGIVGRLEEGLEYGRYFGDVGTYRDAHSC